MDKKYYSGIIKKILELRGGCVAVHQHYKSFNVLHMNTFQDANIVDPQWFKLFRNQLRNSKKLILHIRKPYKSGITWVSNSIS